MRHCLTLPTGGPCADPRFLVDLGVRAEASGWDGVFLEDYVLFQGDSRAPTCDPWVALAALAVRTERVRLGTKVTPLARRRPWIVARQAAAIDQLSNGRMILGAGLGDLGDHVIRDASFSQFGEAAAPAVRAAMLDESLEVIAGLWTGEPFSFDGAHLHIDEVTFLPTPVQRPRIPIWIGGGYPIPGPTARAARWDGSMLYAADGKALQPPDITAIRAAATMPDYDISVSAPASGDPATDAERLHALGAAGATWASVSVQVQDPEEMRRVVERGPTARG